MPVASRIVFGNPRRKPQSGAVQIISPTSSQNIQGIFLIRGTVTMQATPALVEVNVDGGSYRTASRRGNSWRILWNTGSLTAGSHTFGVRATDVNSSTAAGSVNVTVAAQTIIPGLCLFKLGDAGYTNTTNKDKFSAFVVGQPLDGTVGVAAQAASQPTMDLVWMRGTTAFLNQGDGQGLPWATLVANDWVLKDGSGNYVGYNPGDTGQFWLKFGDPGYQAALVPHFVNNVFPRFPGVDGCMCDDVTAETINAASTTSIYPTNFVWRDEMFDFVQVVGGGIQDAGFVMGGNLTANNNDFNGASGSWPAWGQGYNGEQVINWMKALAPWLEFPMYEFWMESGASTPVRTVGNTVTTAYGDDSTVGWRDFLPAVNAAGIAIHANIQSSSTGDTTINTAANVARLTYMKAAFLLDFDPRSGSVCAAEVPHAAYASPLDVWGTMWTLDVGNPAGAKTQPQTNVYRRVFQKGATTYLVLLNANSSGTVTQDGHVLPFGTAYIGV